MSDSVIQGADWWVDSLNMWKRLEYCQPPLLDRATERLTMGGGWASLENLLEIEPLTAEFGLKGSHSDVRGLFGNDAGDWTTFYYYERLRDIMAGVNAGRVVTMKGLLRRCQSPRVTGRRADATAYTISSIVSYKDVFNGQTVHWIDIETNKLVQNGVDKSSAPNALLGGMGSTPSLIANSVTTA